MSSLGSIGLAANHLEKMRLHRAMRLDSGMGFVDNSAFSPALDQCRQSLRIRDAKKAIGKRVSWARKLLADKRCLDTLHW